MLPSAAALLNSLFEHPAGIIFPCTTRAALDALHTRWETPFLRLRNLTQVGRLEITALVAGRTVPTTIGVVSLDTGTSSFQRLPLALPSGLQGQVVTLRFELVGTSADRVRLDNIAFGPGGQPLQVAAPGTGQTVTGLLPLGLIDMPGWNGGVDAGAIQTATPHLLLNEVGAVHSQRLEDDGSAGLGQGGLDDQTLAAHQSWIVSELIGQEQAPFVLGVLAHHLGFDGDASFTPDSHAIQSQFDTALGSVEMMRIHDGVVQSDVEPGIKDKGAFVDNRSIGVSDVNVSRNSSAPSSQGALTNLLIHSLDEVTLFLLESATDGIQTPDFPGEQTGVELGVTAGLSQSEQSNQQPFQVHAVTLSPDAEAVKQIAQMARRLGTVSFEVADLPGTYVALTRFERDQSGTIVSSRVTIDQDAAGYGWFVDLTPLDNRVRELGSLLDFALLQPLWLLKLEQSLFERLQKIVCRSARSSNDPTPAPKPTARCSSLQA